MIKLFTHPLPWHHPAPDPPINAAAYNAAALMAMRRNFRPDTTAPATLISHQENTMSVITDLQTAGTKVGAFLAEVVTFAGKARKLYNSLSGPVLAASLAVFADVVKAVAAAESAAAAASTGNISGTITLSQDTVSLVKVVVTDFKAGEKTVVADFEALGIKL